MVGILQDRIRVLVAALQVVTENCREPEASRKQVHHNEAQIDIALSYHDAMCQVVFVGVGKSNQLLK